MQTSPVTENNRGEHWIRGPGRASLRGKQLHGGWGANSMEEAGEELSKKRKQHLPKRKGGQRLAERTEQCGLKWNEGKVAERVVGKPDSPGRAGLLKL